MLSYRNGDIGFQKPVSLYQKYLHSLAGFEQKIYEIRLILRDALFRDDRTGQY